MSGLSKKCIVVDGRMAQYTRTGIGAYIFNLLNTLGALNRQERLVVLVSDKLPLNGLEEIENLVIQTGAPKYGDYIYREFWEQFTLPKLLIELGADVYHSPNYSLPFIVPTFAAKVVTLYDASLFATPEYYKFVHRTEGRYLIRKSAACADAIIFGSRNAQSEFAKYLGSTVAQKGRSIYIGLPIEVQEGLNILIDDQEVLEAKYHIEAPYVISIGSIHPRKNYARLVEAMSNPKFEKFRLVICGAVAWKSRDLFDAIEKCGMTERVIVTGYLNTKDLLFLLRGAQALAFPSLYEGFGIPPLEAFAAGIPVCASNCSSIPEVVDDAALLFDPMSVDSIVDSLHSVLTDPTLRVTLISRGKSRLNCFSWRSCAEEHLATYQHALENKSR
jgi:glycosyltransferase involved in cell wall biosynthesis